jgi:hypothetical protein
MTQQQPHTHQVISHLHERTCWMVGASLAPGWPKVVVELAKSVLANQQAMMATLLLHQPAIVLESM